MEWLPKRFSITVSGNVGQVVIDSTGPVKSLSIKPPGTGTYDVEMYDSDGDYLVFEDDVSGPGKFTVDENVIGVVTVKISDAPDGVYWGKIRWSKW